MNGDRGTTVLDLGIIVESTGILEVVTLLESTFVVSVKDANLLPEIFDSVASILGFGPTVADLAVDMRARPLLHDAL